MKKTSMGMLALLAASALAAAIPAASRAAVPEPLASGRARNDYANGAFMKPFSTGLKDFYARDFKTAEEEFQKALLVIPDNTLAISFLNAAAAQQPGELDSLTNVEEDDMSGAPKNYANHVRLGFSYMFQSMLGRDRAEDARDELQTAVRLDANRAAAHVGLGIMRFNERSANRAKLELLSALKNDPNNVLAREYLGQLYQSDLQDPQQGLAYMIDVPNLVPGYADIDFHIGSLLFELNQNAAALRYLKQSVAIDTDHVGEAGHNGYTLIARIYIREHDLDEAKKWLDEAVADDVDAMYAQTLLNRIKNGDYSPSPAPGSTGA